MITSLRFGAVIGLLLTILFFCTAVWGDVSTPAPQTRWPRGETPSESKALVVGVSLSLAILAAAVVLSRMRLVASSVAGKAGIAVVAIAALSVTIYSTNQCYRQITIDRELWQKWEQDEADRRSRWRGPPGPAEAPPSISPTPPSSEPAAEKTSPD